MSQYIYHAELQHNIIPRSEKWAHSHDRKSLQCLFLDGDGIIQLCHGYRYPSNLCGKLFRRTSEMHTQQSIKVL